MNFYLSSCSSADLEKKAHEAFESGSWRTTVDVCTELLKRTPDSTVLHFMLGVGLHRIGDLHLALDAFNHVLAIDFSLMQAHLASAAVLADLQRNDEALEHCNAATRLMPFDATANTNTAIILERLGRVEDAICAYSRALSFDPTYCDALKNKSLLLLQCGPVDAAMDCSRQLVEYYPDKPDAQFILGKAALATKNFEIAAEAFGRASRLLPQDVRFLIYRGFALALSQRFGEAEEALGRAWTESSAVVMQFGNEIFSGDERGQGPLDARTLYVLFHYDRAEHCDWSALYESQAQLEKFWGANQPPSEKSLCWIAMALGATPSEQLHLTTQVAEKIINGLGPSDFYPSLTTGGRLKVAYLSADFRAHAIGYLCQGLFALHDRQSFEVFSYCLASAASDVPLPAIVEGCDHFVVFGDQSDGEVAERIRQDHIDILIDLSGYTTYSRQAVLAYRVAPIQISWLGYLGTSGSPWIDYIVADRVAIPHAAELHYSESVIRLPNTLWFCSYAQEQSVVDAPTRATQGLPEDGLVLAAFHNGYKIEPEIFSVWMRLLAAFPNAVLWLAEGSREMVGNIEREARLSGIKAERLVFAPRISLAQHLARYQLADIALDTPRYNGGATTVDALVAGVPVISKVGESPTQRMAASALNAAGLPEGIVHSLEEYEAIARQWMQDAKLRSGLRERLAQSKRAGSFLDPEKWVREFEHALTVAAQRKRAGLPATAIDL